MLKLNLLIGAFTNLNRSDVPYPFSAASRCGFGDDVACKYTLWRLRSHIHIPSSENMLPEKTASVEHQNYPSRRPCGLGKLPN
jgi:hypothetical protein